MPFNAASRVPDALESLDGTEFRQLQRTSSGQIALFQLAGIIEEEHEKLAKTWRINSMAEQRVYHKQLKARVMERWRENHSVAMDPLLVIILGNLIWWFIKNVILE